MLWFHYGVFKYGCKSLMVLSFSLAPFKSQACKILENDVIVMCLVTGIKQKAIGYQYITESIIDIYPSNWIKFGVSSLASLFSLLCMSSWIELLTLFIFVEIVSLKRSSGFGCIKVKGSSATRSLLIEIIFKDYRDTNNFAYPPNGVIHNFTFTLYCTIIPRFSFWATSEILSRLEN